STKVDAGCVIEILGGAGDLPDGNAFHENLRPHFVVENKIITVAGEIDTSQYLSRESPVAGVVFAEFFTEHNVFKQGQQTVENVLIKRHPAFQGAVAQDAGSQYYRIQVACNNIGHRGNEQGRVLVIRMQHDHDVCAKLQRFF